MAQGGKNNHLIKFHSINDFLKKSLSTESFYATPLDVLNDPVEKIEIVPFARSFMSNYSLEYRNKCGIYCVTKFSSKHFSSHLLPMWAYYGDNHSGVCLVLQAKEVLQNDWSPITYVDMPTNFSIDASRDTEFQIAKKSLLYKLKPWSHEQEYRLIFPHKEAGRMQTWNKYFNLKQIIFGYKCKPEKINEVLSWLSNNLKERLKKEVIDHDFLDIRQVREPWSIISDMPPLRIIIFEKYESLIMTGHKCTYEQNSKDFYPIGSLYAGQIPVMRMPDFTKTPKK